MKKPRLLSLALVALLSLTLAGCGSPASLPDASAPPDLAASPAPDQTASQTQPETTVAPTPIPVEPDVFYYANALEFDRLYRQKKDGTGLTRVLDESVSNVIQQDGRVYFMDGRQALCYYDIPTAQRFELLPEVQSYAVDGDDLVYAIASTTEDGHRNPFVPELHHLTLSTGKDTMVATVESHLFKLKDGYLYYTQNDWTQEQSSSLVSYCLDSGAATTLEKTSGSIMSLYPVSGGVYYTVTVNQKGSWKFAQANGAETTDLPASIPTDATLIHASAQRFYYIASSDYERNTPPALHQVTADGQDTVLVSGQSGGYMTAEPAGSGWIVSASQSVGWGEKNTYGSYEHYAQPCTYHYLDGETGAITPLSAADTEGQLFAQGDFPILDSSTARKPVTTALYNLFVKNYGYTGSEPLCSTTHNAWLNIADRKADLALLAAPTQEEQDYLTQKGVEVEMKLYGGDGLVFIGNKANPVTDLTHEQLIAIYRGEITNWSQLGGPDHAISVYYRDDQSGSQRLFEKLVFKGLDIPAFQDMGFYLMDEMSTIVNICLEDPYAIGYSIMTYLDDVYAEEDLKVFSVNGVTPSAETVKDKSYPYHTQGYQSGPPAIRLVRLPHQCRSIDPGRRKSVVGIARLPAGKVE